MSELDTIEHTSHYDRRTALPDIGNLRQPGGSDTSSRSIGPIEVYRSLANEQGSPLDISIRRIEVPPFPQEILAAVEGKFGVTVAIQLGLRDGSGVSRHLSDLRNRLPRERKARSALRNYQSYRICPARVARKDRQDPQKRRFARVQWASSHIFCSSAMRARAFGSSVAWAARWRWAVASASTLGL